MRNIIPERSNTSTENNYTYGSCRKEHSLWHELMPQPSQLDDLNNKFPVKIDPNNREARDKKSYPFGCLTAKGLVHMHSVGESLARKFPLISMSSSLDVEVVSTNYLRTQVSTQALLSGIRFANGEHQKIFPVNVRDTSKCSMSVYEGKKELATSLIKAVQKQDSFRRMEEEVRHAKDHLLHYFPLLRRDDNSLDWMSAFDHFVCRTAHDLAFDENVRHLANVVTEHVPRRYSQYFTNGAHLGFLGAGPLLKDILNKTEQMYTTRNNRNGPILKVFSGHDVNILGLLYALGADPELIKPPFWPDFGSNIVLEIFLDDLKVNLYYNLKPLRITTEATATAGDDVCSSNTESAIDENSQVPTLCNKNKEFKTSTTVNQLQEIYKRIELNRGFEEL